MRTIYWRRQYTSAFQLTFILSLLLWQGMNNNAAGAALHPPETIQVYYQLFVNVRSLTSFPFTMFPGLGGADKGRFSADDLINRDELLHTTAYLKGQLVIRIVFSPDTVKELQITINACDFLSRHFNRIATQRDVQGNLAMGEGDIDQLFVTPAAEKHTRADTAEF